jgi:hypothetical protein
MSAMGWYLSGEMLKIEDGEAGAEVGEARAEAAKQKREAKTRNAPDARSGGLPVTA